jgi:hypothetical protein
MGYLDERDFRQYLHELREDFDPSSVTRVDFTETVAFVAGSELVATLGSTFQLQVPAFYLAEQVSQFVIKVDLYSSKGRYGFGSKTVKSSVPVFSKFSVPTSMIAGDMLSVPVTIYNSRSTSVSVEYAVIDREVSGNDVSMLATESGTLTIAAGGSAQFAHTLDCSDVSTAPLRDANAGRTVYMQVSLKLDGAIVDSSILGATVVNDGFEDWLSGGGMIGVSSDNAAADTARTLTWTVDFPSSLREVDEMAVKVNKINVEMIKDALISMARMPTGCFEQTASTVAPQIGAYQVMTEILAMEEEAANNSDSNDSEDRDPSTETETDSVPAPTPDDETGDGGGEAAILGDYLTNIQAGYQRMTTYETEGGGYEWFGQGAGHETLTAYGLGIFNDIKKIASDIVDDDTVTRNAAWLQSRSNPSSDKIYDLNERSLDTFGRASQDISDAYITYQQIIGKRLPAADELAALQHLEAIAGDSSDPYYLSLTAIAEF